MPQNREGQKTPSELPHAVKATGRRSPPTRSHGKTVVVPLPGAFMPTCLNHARYNELALAFFVNTASTASPASR